MTAPPKWARPRPARPGPKPDVLRGVPGRPGPVFSVVIGGPGQWRQGDSCFPFADGGDPGDGATWYPVAAS